MNLRGSRRGPELDGNGGCGGWMVNGDGGCGGWMVMVDVCGSPPAKSWPFV